MILDEIKINPYTPLQKIEDTITNEFGVSLFMKRLDLIHPEISGNKWFKLKYNLLEARSKGFETLLTFGGAYSNHIYAAAAAGNIFDFKTIGIIRGEEHLPLNPTLDFATKKGMRLYYLNRSNYRIKDSEEILTRLQNKFGKFYLIPEGGSNKLAVKGCREIIDEMNQSFDYICTASGTGGTLAGLVSAISPNQKALGFSVLKGGDFLNQNVSNLLNQSNVNVNRNWEIFAEYHLGGYAKITPQLIKFIKEFGTRTGIALEPIYSGKMLFGIYELIRKRFFKRGSKIIALHNGGMQGLKGMEAKIKLLGN
jgi:1-aminocyclopropane-1-carboxylate deaminase